MDSLAHSRTDNHFYSPTRVVVASPFTKRWPLMKLTLAFYSPALGSLPSASFTLTQCIRFCHRAHTHTITTQTHTTTTMTPSPITAVGASDPKSSLVVDLGAARAFDRIFLSEDVAHDGQLVRKHNPHTYRYTSKNTSCARV